MRISHLTIHKGNVPPILVDLVHAASAPETSSVPAAKVGG